MPLSKTEHIANLFSDTVVIVFGIFGNMLVVILILRQKNVLKNNYYFLVLHLAICDLVVLIVYILGSINRQFLEQPFFDFGKFDCLGYDVSYFFQVSGIGMMLMISVLRYRATVHPFKPPISRWKLNVACGLVYIVGFFAGYVPFMPLCLMENWDHETIAYYNYSSGYIIFSFYFCPTTFMAVLYFKIGRTLVNQSKYIKSICSKPAVRRSAPSSSFNILTFFRNRKTFFVCLFTVLCYAIGNIPYTMYFTLHIAEEYRLLAKNPWILYCAVIVRVAGSHSANPLIYGIFDKKLLKFWKLKDLFH